MLYHRKKYRHLCKNSVPLFLLCCALFCFAGCTSSDSGSGNTQTATAEKSDTQDAQGTRDATPQVLTAQASGEVTYGSDLVTLDASHTSDGYVMLRYSGNNEKVKVQVTLPDSTEYTYPVTASSTPFPVEMARTRSRCWNRYLQRIICMRFLLHRTWTFRSLMHFHHFYTRIFM